ncbi:MAG TPA: proline dehydrogenase family protein, partial [Rhodocyclaceae bacterium]|nr:proline dehydrogenase family protein [Rhodocyclaceae bacterium]
MGTSPLTPFEAEFMGTATELLAAGAGDRPPLYTGINGTLLEHAMADGRLSQALFRFVDVLPQLQRLPDPDRAIARHLAAYLDEADAHDWLAQVIRWGARPGLAWLARRQVRALARQFLAEEGRGGLEAVLAQLARVPALATVDAVGEAVLSDAEADAYRDRNLALLDRLAASGAKPHLSLKLTALTPRFDPLDPAGTRSRVFARLAPIVESASRHGATLTVDMEQYELKPLILQLFLDALGTFSDRRWQPAIALQAYLPDTRDDCRQVVDAAQLHARRLGIRLVKGAYWDQEAAWAAQRGWRQPTWKEKAHTDWHYEQLTAFLLDHTDSLKPAIAAHNLRSQAVALTHARRRGLQPDAWEVQMLLGMAEPLRDALAAAGVPLRIYVPVGDAEIGIAYLIRRLLENTASTSILRRTHVEGDDLDTLLAPPAAPPATEHGESYPPAGFHNLPLLDFSRPGEIAAFAAALEAVKARCTPADASAAAYHSRNPARPEEILGGTPITAAPEAEAAIRRARAAFASWSTAPAAGRAAILREAARRITAERRQLAALQVLECAKPWREADGDVAEAVDFLRYYAADMEKLDGWHTTTRFPGEDNRFAYAPRGVAVVISPWNFPLAILAGMSSAALLAGNTVVMKPALPALLTAREYLRILRESGLPADVCQLVVGEAELGAQLVAHADVDLIAFTGSRQVGLAIQQAAHTPQADQSHIKQVVCEMGGKNAIVVDEDADLDEAVAGIIAS